MKYDFKNPEHFKALEKQAYECTIEIADFPPAAYRYFDCLRSVYARFKYDNLSRADAENEKKKLLTQYQEAVSAWDYMSQFRKNYQENIRRAGTLLSEIEKSNDTAEIALKACECIGLMTGDGSFLKRQAKKIMEVNNEPLQRS